MGLEVVAAAVVDGVMLGFVYGLAASGLTLIFGVNRVVNLAHGPVMALGMFALYGVTTRLAISPYLVLPAIPLLGMALGLVVYRAALHRLREAPELTTLLSTFAVSLIILGLCTVVFTTTPRAIELDLGDLARLGAVSVTWSRALAAVAACAATAALYALLYRTRFGRSVRAVASNRAAAELVGIDSAAVLAASFGIGTALAMTAGALVATLFPFSILSGATYELKSFVIVVLGGLGNPTGALAAGLLLGLVEGVATALIPVSWVPVIEYGLFVLVLRLRPAGLLAGGGG